jgi:hypothetical protein
MCSGQPRLVHASKHTKPGLRPPPTAIATPGCSPLLPTRAGDALSKLFGCSFVDATHLIAGQASSGARLEGLCAQRAAAAALGCRRHNY